MAMLQKELLLVVSHWSDYTDDVDKVLQFVYCNLYQQPYLRPGTLLILATYIKVCTFNNEKNSSQN